MRKKLDKGILKHVKEVKAFVPNNIRLSFYMTEVGDVSSKIEFTEQDLDNINLLDDDNFINPELFDMLNDDEGNIYALMDEGVLQGRSTGADLGIYNYEPIKPVEKVKIDYSKYISDEFIRSIDDDINDIAFDSGDDYGFSHCVLAEGNNLGGYNTQIVNTFKGYLEVTKSDFSIIRNCDCDSDNCFNVYVPQQYINKYQLRNGDELVCTCKESKGKMLLTSLFAINQESRYTFNCSRPWFKDLPYVKKSRNLNIDGEYMTTIINKFELFEGDSVFLYLNKTSQKQKVLNGLLEELSDAFDKVIYINPQYTPNTITIKSYNVVKFCTHFANTARNQIISTLLGANYARRLIEMGKSVAIVIDDINSIMALDNEYTPEMPVSKTVLGSTKVTLNGGSTSFAIIPLRSNDVNSYTLNSLFKSVETLGIVIENNEIDLFNSYRA